jgi:membrane protease YdiL (CAAX protease family)
MRIYLAFVLYLATCMLLSALLLPWLQPWFAAWLGAPPDRSLYRFGMLLTALGLPLLLRRLRLTERSLMGWQAPSGGTWPALARGLGLGALMLAVVITTLLLLGVRHPLPQHLHATRILGALAGGLLSGLAVGLLEEFFFRGPLQGGMRQRLPLWPSALLIGLFYAVVHFIRPAPLQGGVLDITSSLRMLADGLAKLGQFDTFADSFFALVAAGIFLSLLRERTGSLAMAIGVHAGWVTVIRLAKRTSATDHGAAWIGLIGDYDNITGWLTCGVIVAFGALYWLGGAEDPHGQHD